MPLHHATLHQMKIFLTLAQHLNMTRAAEALHMTPAALSIQVKQLAETVGAPLHEQIGKRLYLTETGRMVEEACRDLFARLERLGEELAEARGLERGRLRVAIITTAKYFVPRLLGDFCKRHPGIEVALEVANRDQILARLKQNLDDLYIMGQVPEQLGVISWPLMKNLLVVVAPAGHPLASERDIDPLRLVGEPFIAREAGSGTRLAAERFFERHGVRRLNVRMTLGSNEAVKQAVAGGLGLAVLSRHTLALDESSGAFEILDVRGFPLERQWSAVYPKGKQLSLAAQAFLEHLIAAG
ncbi:LysR family transcriptional regulator [Thiococcus pfennigii]|uniref:LysR family transcriptional regulator n=1 Tax=Thiococcus pfennigii TaxID=1057 RepID=UPI00190376ED|nr:LysR family transcriptional regulator [Thiococcus pfennigii]MBK1699616.1 LysR family transcriptional regulator [Thiococcus pfennigii]MBK1731791.1 LysR family transcriptional regulator [Thiococcus pfennigii]